MVLTQKIEIFPNIEQEQKLLSYFGVRRWIWNQSLVKWNDMYQEVKSRLDGGATKYDVKGMYPTGWTIRNHIKSDLPEWYDENYSMMIIDSTCEDLELGFKAMYRKRSKDKSPGKFFPRFKKKGVGDSSFRLFKKNNLSINIKDNRIYLPKFSRKVNGKVIKSGIKLAEPIKCNQTDIKTCTVSRSNTNRYYITISYETTKFSQTKPKRTVGVDLGVKTFATIAYKSENQRLYDDVHYDMKKLKFLEDKIARGNRKMAKSIKNSRKYNRLKLSLNKTYESIKNLKSDFLHKFTTNLVNRFKTIVIEDLNVSGMIKNRKLARAVARLNFYQFRQILTYKCNLFNRKLIIADRFYPSTQTCSACGFVRTGKDKLKLSDRKYICPDCGVVHNRDKNAAYNLMNLAYTLEHK